MWFLYGLRIFERGAVDFMRIVLTGGGTAGHVTPHLALIPKLQKEGWEIHYIGSENGMERELIGAIEGVTYHGVKSGKLRRYHDMKNFTDPFRVIAGMGQAAKLIRKLKPNVVFSKGGYVSVPVVYAAALNRVPTLIHESDMTSGLANKLSLPFAKVLMCTFPETAKEAGEKGLYIGSPIRDELLRGNRERGLKTFGFNDSRPVLLVVGGSLGAQAINRAVRKALPKLTQCFQVLHICGNGNTDSVYEGMQGYTQTQYLNEAMPDAYACADVIVSRAGSNTICELLALRKPSLLIPYPSTASRGDQEINAASFLRRGFSRVLEQSDLTPETLVERVVEVYRDRGELIDCMNREPMTHSVDRIMEQIHKYARKDKE